MSTAKQHFKAGESHGQGQATAQEWMQSTKDAANATKDKTADATQSATESSQHGKDKSASFIQQLLEKESQNSWNTGFGFNVSDRRLAFSRQASFDQVREPHTSISINLNDPAKPLLARSISSMGFYTL